jgi:hypothetical protein
VKNQSQSILYLAEENENMISLLESHRLLTLFFDGASAPVVVVAADDIVLFVGVGAMDIKPTSFEYFLCLVKQLFNNRIHPPK